MVLLDCSKEQLLRSSVFTGKFLTVYLCKVCHFILHTLQLPSLIPVLLAFMAVFMILPFLLELNSLIVIILLVSFSSCFLCLRFLELFGFVALSFSSNLENFDHCFLLSSPLNSSPVRV